MEFFKSSLKYILSGALIYWGTEFIVQFLFRAGGTLWLILLTALVPLVTTAGYFALRKRDSENCSPAIMALLMLFGIWFLGPVFMILGSLRYKPENLAHLPNILKTYLFFPIYTFSMSIYNGSMGGLIAISIVLFAISLGHVLARRFCLGVK